MRRSAQALVVSSRTMEGGGFVVRRPFPTEQMAQFDPFLLLDEMGPVEWSPGEAVGAPDHPHRGFETVTYLLDGEMRHRDSHGNQGDLGPGDVQWMTAGSGVIHSEMPSPRLRKGGGRVHGFQLWINLPREHKMMAPRYQDVPADKSPVVFSEEGDVRVRVIAGRALGQEARLTTVIPITYLHISLQATARFVAEVPKEQSAFAYVFEGGAKIGLGGERVRDADEGQAILLGQEGDEVEMQAGHLGAEVLLIGGKSLGEPVARYGPFVMNTSDEIRQAMADYQSGQFGRIPPNFAD
jgi:redox-sensitive bicupin YhaK (pirin superfamily)